MAFTARSCPIIPAAAQFGRIFKLEKHWGHIYYVISDKTDFLKPGMHFPPFAIKK
jgi:hypothetical protein